MWTDSFHRFASEAAFLAACDVAGWTRGPDGKPSPPAGIAVDVVGPAIAPASLTGTLVTPGAIDPRWHVNVSWFSGTSMPSSFGGAEVIPERPVRMFAVRDPAQKVAALKVAFDARKLARPDDPRLVSVGANVEVDVEIKGSRKPRRATVALRFGAIDLVRPARVGARDQPRTVALWVVDVCEVDPPQGAEPVHWRLLTTHPVATLDQARQIVS